VTIVARAWSFTTPSLWAPNSSKLLFNLPNLTWLGSSWGLIPKALKGSQFGPPFFSFFFSKVLNSWFKRRHIMLCHYGGYQPQIQRFNVTTLALGSRPKQRLVKVCAKKEAQKSHFMFPRV
jgi:hypothetical protein